MKYVEECETVSGIWDIRKYIRNCRKVLMDKEGKREL